MTPIVIWRTILNKADFLSNFGPFFISSLPAPKGLVWSMARVRTGNPTDQPKTDDKQ